MLSACSLVMNSNLPLSLKRKVYNQCVLPVLTYGSESWRLTKKQGVERKLGNAHWNGEKNTGHNMERQEANMMDQGRDKGQRYPNDN